jgi:hypothetical protein
MHGFDSISRCDMAQDGSSIVIHTKIDALVSSTILVVVSLYLARTMIALRFEVKTFVSLAWVNIKFIHMAIVHVLRFAAQQSVNN